MKKFVSVILTIALLVSSAVFSSVAADDACIRLSDSTGSTGYSAGADSINSAVASNGGVTLIFDVLAESFTAPSEGQFSQIVAFTGGPAYNFAGYSFSESAFTAGVNNAWVASNQADYKSLATRSFEWELNRWYELALQFDGREVVVYLDGVPMIAAEYDSTVTDYIILYPQFCTVLIDNMRVCGKDYNVRDRVGEVIAVEDFTGVTSIDGSDVWLFDKGGSYTVSYDGRPMPELGDLLPDRTVAPSITGAYLKYTESAGSGVVPAGIDFTAYNGFTVVQDIRVDRKSVGAHMGVRFGGNYLAGYDWDTGSFRIAGRSGYGFNTMAAYTYAVVEYALEVGETYEMAVRQSGDVVSVYLNGVLVAQAQNEKFATGFSNIQLSNYRIGVSVDNMVIAYPDYNVKEATGGKAAKFTFDESAAYINGIWQLGLGGTGYGYSIAAEAGAPAVSVSSAEAAEGSASVSVSVSGCAGFDSYEISVSYPDSFTVVSAVVSENIGGLSQVSPIEQNPLKLLHIADSEVVDSDVLEITFNTPEDEGDYPIVATLTPYTGDVPGAEITGTGTVTVPEPGLLTGLPDGIAYDGGFLTWNAADGAVLYDVYVVHPDGYEEYVDSVEETEYEIYFEDYIYDEGVYGVILYCYDEEYDTFAVSDPFTVVCDADETVYAGIPAYAEKLHADLTAAFADKDYSEANRDKADAILAEAAESMSAAADYGSLMELYNGYLSELEGITEGSSYILGDVNGDGIVTSIDANIIARMLSGAGIDKSIAADFNSDGNVTAVDLQLLTRKLSGAGI